MTRLSSKFNPYLLTISFQNVFISNKFVKNNQVYKVIETYFNNINDDFIIKNLCSD